MPEWPGLGEEGLEDGRVEGRLGRPKSGLEGRLPSGRLMPGLLKVTCLNVDEPEETEE